MLSLPDADKSVNEESLHEVCKIALKFRLSYGKAEDLEADRPQCLNAAMRFGFQGGFGERWGMKGQKKAINPHVEKQDAIPSR